MAKKIQGTRYPLSHGFEIYVHPTLAKTPRGKDRIWLHIRQTKDPKWVNDESLMYVNSADIRFVAPEPKKATAAAQKSAKKPTAKKKSAAKKKAAPKKAKKVAKKARG